MYLLTALKDMIKTQSFTEGFTPEQKLEFKDFVVQWIITNCENILSHKFLLNKVSLLYIGIFESLNTTGEETTQAELWPDAFNEVL